MSSQVAHPDRCDGILVCLVRVPLRRLQVGGDGQCEWSAVLIFECDRAGATTGQWGVGRSPGFAET